MYKIKRQTDSRMQPTDKYDVECYIFDENSHSNKMIWSVVNLLEKELAPFMQGQGNGSVDMDFNFVILKSNNGPIILTVDGECLAIPVKVKAKEVQDGNNTTDSLFRAAGRTTLSS